MEDFRDDRDSAVDGVGDDKDECFRGDTADSRGKVTDDRGVGLLVV